jgi:hypothetical protein
MKFRSVFCVVPELALLCASSGLSSAQKDAKAFRFDQFPVNTYQGHLKIPRWFHGQPGGMGYDERGKLADWPHVTFAGEYYLAVHSCGTCCGYYTLNNLRTGREVTQIGMFDAGDTPPVTKDGHTYLPYLIFKPDSKLLIVQYELDLCTQTENNQCRQRYFVFKDGKITAISKTFPSCTKEGDEPE